MVKLIGPAMSIDASGALGGVMVFSKWKGRNYARQLVVPTNPKSGMQTGMRSMLGALSKQWALLSAGEKAVWENLADADVISPFNAFVKFNQLRHRNFKSPCIDPTDTDAGLTQSVFSGFDAVDGIRSATVTLTVDTLNGGWGAMVFRDTLLAGTADLAHLVHVFFFHATGAMTWVDSPLAVGSHYYNYRAFTTDGLFGGCPGAWNLATVT